MEGKFSHGDYVTVLRNNRIGTIEHVWGDLEDGLGCFYDVEFDDGSVTMVREDEIMVGGSEFSQGDIRVGPVVSLAYRWLPYVWIAKDGKAVWLKVCRVSAPGRMWMLDISLSGRDWSGLELAQRIDWYTVDQRV